MVFSHEAVKVHGQLVVIQPVAHDVVTVLQQYGETEEEHEWVPLAKLLGRGQAQWVWGWQRLPRVLWGAHLRYQGGSCSHLTSRRGLLGGWWR